MQQQEGGPPAPGPAPEADHSPAHDVHLGEQHPFLEQALPGGDGSLGTALGQDVQLGRSEGHSKMNNSYLKKRLDRESEGRGGRRQAAGRLATGGV
jgi:hypothetical protein